MEVLNFVKKFGGVLEDTDTATLQPETVFRDIAEWDSLIALSLIAMVDEEYHVKLTGDDIRASKTLQDLYDKIKSKG